MIMIICVCVVAGVNHLIFPLFDLPFSITCFFAHCCFWDWCQWHKLSRWALFWPLVDEVLFVGRLGLSKRCVTLIAVSVTGNTWFTFAGDFRAWFAILSLRLQISHYLTCKVSVRYKPDAIKGDMDSIRTDVLDFYKNLVSISVSLWFLGINLHV